MRGKFALGFLFLSFIFSIVQLGMAQTVSVQTASVEVGATTQIPLVLDSAPQGLASFAITVSLANGSVADIVDVIWPDIFRTTGVFRISADHSSVTLLASDSGDAVHTGATEVELAQVVFQGKAAGSSELQVQADQVKDDSGAQMEVGAAGGSLTVTGAADPPPVFSNPDPLLNAMVTDSQPTISIKITDVGSGVDPEAIQMRVEDSSGSHSFNKASPGANWDGTTFSIDLKEAGISLAAGEIDVWVTAADRGKHMATTTWSFTVQAAVMSIVAAVAAHSGDPTLIEDEDILWAIGLWVEGTEVPGTGETISDEGVLSLIDLWIEGTTVGP